MVSVAGFLFAAPFVGQSAFPQAVLCQIVVAVASQHPGRTVLFKPGARPGEIGRSSRVLTRCANSRSAAGVHRDDRHGEPRRADRVEEVIRDACGKSLHVEDAEERLAAEFGAVGDEERRVGY